MRTLVASLFVLVACSGSSPPPAPDAATAAPGTFGATCTVVSNMSTECMSGVCTNTVDMAGSPVCSVQCTYGDNSTCPSGSMGQKCNMKGYCRP